MNQPEIRTALIANQNVAVRRGLRQLLEGLSYEIVAEASDGGDALARALRTRPAIAIIDLSLRGLNGFELLRALKSELPETKLLVYTLHRREDWRREALQAGADAYILKDEPEGELIAAIERLGNKDGEARLPSNPRRE
jgi:two-component system nitrate/nitrite response regulator NarL